MFDFGKICSEYENMTDAERRITLAEDARAIMPALAAINGDGVSEFIVFVMTACAADGKFDIEEYKLFADVSGITVDYADALAAVEAANTKEYRDAVDLVVDIFGLLDDDIKASMISFCLCFCSANGKINSKEKKFIKRLIK